MIDLHFQTLLEMTSGRSTPRTGSQLDLRSTNVAALCLQLLVELSQRHVDPAELRHGLSGLGRRVVGLLHS